MGQPPDRNGGEAQGQGLTRQQPLHRRQQFVERTGAVKQPGAVIRQHVNVLHRRDWRKPLTDQPDPLIEQPEVVGVALQQTMPEGTAAPADQPQADGQTPELPRWVRVYLHRQSCQLPGTAGAFS